MNAQTAKREARKNAKSKIPKEVMARIEDAVRDGASEAWIRYEFGQEPWNLRDILLISKRLDTRTERVGIASQRKEETLLIHVRVSN